MKNFKLQIGLLAFILLSATSCISAKGINVKKVDATISPFLKNFIFIAEKEFSLADIKKGILQKMNEPRIHFAINCA